MSRAAYDRVRLPLPECILEHFAERLRIRLVLEVSPTGTREHQDIRSTASAVSQHVPLVVYRPLGLLRRFGDSVDRATKIVAVPRSHLESDDLRKFRGRGGTPRVTDLRQECIIAGDQRLNVCADHSVVFFEVGSLGNRRLIEISPVLTELAHDIRSCVISASNLPNVQWGLVVLLLVPR